MQVALRERCLSTLLQAARVCVVAKDLIQVNACFCLYFASFLCTAGCMLKTEFYADLNNIIFYFPAMLKFAVAQNGAILILLRGKLLLLPQQWF